MALSLSATDLAIGLAIKAGSLRKVVRQSRYGLGEFYSLEDDVGVIEVHPSSAEADERIKAIEERIDG
jgi:predicted nuclease with RNAse H fold